MDIFGMDEIKKDISTIKQEIITLKIINATFEERFERMSKEIESQNLLQNEKIKNQLEETKELRRSLEAETKELKDSIKILVNWSITWRTTLIISLIVLVTQVLFIPLEKYFHLFGL